MLLDDGLGHAQQAGRHPALNHGRVRVTDLGDAVGWSRRRLSGRFYDEFGLTRKEASRVSRFDLSRRLVIRGVPLAQAAASSGYADQPHLTREWRDLSGYTPTEYLRAEIHPA